jgi:hypothetical protein
MSRESIVFYESFYEAIDSLPKDQQADCYRAIMRYGLYGEEPEPGNLGYTMWLAFRKQIDVNQKRFENSKKRKKKDADQSETKTESNNDQNATKAEPKCDQSETKHLPNVNVNVNENVNDNVNENVNDNEKDILQSTDVDCLSEFSEPRERIDYQGIINAYNNTCISLPEVKKLTESRRQSIRARLNEGYTVEQILENFRKVERSDFLSGRSGRWTACNFDWIMKPSNFIKIYEGNYENRASPKGTANELNDFYQMTAEWASEREGETIHES